MAVLRGLLLTAPDHKRAFPHTRGRQARRGQPYCLHGAPEPGRGSVKLEESVACRHHHLCEPLTSMRPTTHCRIEAADGRLDGRMLIVLVM